jgi:DNA-binding beta-propeller fold protein YncE
VGGQRGNGRVLRIDPGTGRTRSVVRTGGNPRGLAAAGSAVWVATDGSGLLTRIDARTGQVTSRIRVSDAPAAVVADAAGLWVFSPLDATVSRVDPRRHAATATIALGGQPSALAESGGSVWIGDRADGTLLRLAPGNDVVTRFGLGGRVSALAAASGGLWAAIDTAGASHRGGTLTTINTIDGPVTTIDPAAAGYPVFDRRARPAQRRHPLLRAAVPARWRRCALLPGHQRHCRVPEGSGRL